MKVKKLIKVLQAEINTYNKLINTGNTENDQYYLGQCYALNGVISMINDPSFLDAIGEIWNVK